MNFLLAICQRTEKKQTVEYGKISESDFNVAKNKAFLRTITPLDKSFLEKNDSNIEKNKAKDWENKHEKNKPIFEAWIKSGESLHVKNKLIRILQSNILIPKQ